MILYQAEHNNCEPYEDNYSYRENKVYRYKEELIKRLKEAGYEAQSGQVFVKGNPKRFDDFDLVTIYELKVNELKGDE